jgi:hypothetical protein
MHEANSRIASSEEVAAAVVVVDSVPASPDWREASPEEASAPPQAARIVVTARVSTVLSVGKANLRG